MLRTRIAPTPSGFLHIGNGFSFLLTYLICRKHRGSLLLRIDDADSERKRPEYIEDIFESLKWLGITWNEGPLNADDFEKNWSQINRRSDYMNMLSELAASGNVFACECSRKKLESFKDLKRYPDICTSLRIPFDQPETAWRIHVPEDKIIHIDDVFAGAVDYPLGKDPGSFIVRKRDGEAAYQVSSLSDDLKYNINFIVRGEDLLSSTASQLYLAEMLNRKAFQQIRFLHHPLQKDDNGNKLSKSAGSVSLQYMRKHGFKPADVYRLFCEQLLGIQAQPQSMDELAMTFEQSSHPFA
ncbi:MAG: hypothetical protein Fur0041_19380 [Bacteroidia bacterium]